MDMFIGEMEHGCFFLHALPYEIYEYVATCVIWHLIPWLKCCQIYIGLLYITPQYQQNSPWTQDFSTFFRFKESFSDVDLTDLNQTPKDIDFSFQWLRFFELVETRPMCPCFFFSPCAKSACYSLVSHSIQLAVSNYVVFHHVVSLIFVFIVAWSIWNRSKPVSPPPYASTNHPPNIHVLRTSRIWIWTMAIWVATSPGLSQKIRNRQLCFRCSWCFWWEDSTDQKRMVCGEKARRR